MSSHEDYKDAMGSAASDLLEQLNRSIEEVFRLEEGDYSYKILDRSYQFFRWIAISIGNNEVTGDCHITFAILPHRTKGMYRQLSTDVIDVVQSFCYDLHQSTGLRVKFGYGEADSLYGSDDYVSEFWE
jgi:hypothetical protein